MEREQDAASLLERVCTSAAGIMDMLEDCENDI